MASQEKNDSPSAAGPQSKLLLVFAGIMIPLLALAFPYLIEWVSPKAYLVYETTGPIQVEDTKAFSLVVRNEGKAVERNVEITMPSKLEKSTSKVTSSVPVTTRDDGKSTIIALGDLRPSEKVQVSILVSDPLFFLHEYSMNNFRIVSTDHLAQWGGKSEEWEFMYRAGFWGFMLMLVAGIGIGLYQEHFMSRAAREKFILREMEKLK